MLKIVFKNSYAIELLVSLSRNWGTCDRRIAARFPVLIFTSNYQPLSINVTFNDWKSSVQRQGSFLFSTHHFSLKQAYTFHSSSLGSCGSSACFVVVILLSVTWNPLNKIQSLKLPKWKSTKLFWCLIISTSPSDSTAKSWHGNPSYLERISHHLVSSSQIPWQHQVCGFPTSITPKPNLLESDKSFDFKFSNLHR